MFQRLVKFILPILFLSLFTSAQDFNDVDAVSSASGKYRITSGKAYKDKATLNYRWQYPNGTMSIKWGKTSSMSDGSQSISVYPMTGTITINSLEPNTLYNFQLYGTWAGYNYPNLGKGTFTTASDGVVTFSLNVESGSGSGDYEEGENVTITANSPSAGKEFDKWTGDVATVEDVNSSTTVITIPAENVSVIATYKDKVADKFTLTVESGTGDGDYEAGVEVNISADSPPSGKEFDKWTGNVSNIEDVNSSNTKLTMPSENITVTATYKDKVADKFTLTVENGTGSGDYDAGAEVNISADSPASGKVFDKWTGSVSNVEDVNNSNTKLTMPSENITVTATYKDEAVDPIEDNYLKETVWEPEIDGHGSSIDLDTSDLANKGFSAKLYLKQTVDTNYTWSKVSGYSGGNFSNITEVAIVYTSDKDFNIILEQKELSELGTAYEYKVTAANKKQIKISIADFKQPSWVDNEPDLQKPLDLTQVLGISFAAIAENAEINIEVEKINLRGYEDTPIIAALGSKANIKNVSIQGFNKENMVLAVSQSGTYKISVLSLSGRLLFSEVKSLTGGLNSKIDFKSANLSNGLHLVNVTTRNKTYSFKSIIR